VVSVTYPYDRGFESDLGMDVCVCVLCAIYRILAVPGMRCNASRKPPFRWTSHEVR
jgi:hypothetical protein